MKEEINKLIKMNDIDFEKHEHNIGGNIVSHFIIKFHEDNYDRYLKNVPLWLKNLKENKKEVSDNWEVELEEFILINKKNNN